MAEMVVALGVSDLNKAARALKALAAQFEDEVKVDIEQGVGAAIAQYLVGNIASIVDVDGNYLGTENPNASVTVEVNPMGWHEVLWKGKQIVFVEFGTGATGASSPYPGMAMSAAGYSPDPTKASWIYKDQRDGSFYKTSGIPPYAPMFKAALMMRGAVVPIAAPIVRRVIRDAVALR